LVVVVKGGAQSGALGTHLGDIPPELQLVIEAWGTLPEATKVGILAMVQGPILTAEEGKTIMV